MVFSGGKHLENESSKCKFAARGARSSRTEAEEPRGDDGIEQHTNFAALDWHGDAASQRSAAALKRAGNLARR